MEDSEYIVGPLSTIDFYIYCLYLYLFLVLLVAVIYADDQPEKPLIKKVIAKQKGRKFPFPQGKVAYCTYCERYILKEGMVSGHESGKQHKMKAAGAKKWYEFRSLEEAKNAQQLADPANNVEMDRFNKFQRYVLSRISYIEATTNYRKCPIPICFQVFNNRKSLERHMYSRHFHY